MPIAQNKYPPQNHPAFLALAEEVERVKKMEGGTAFIVDLIEAVVESQGLVVVDKAEYESLSPGKVEGWREERERCAKLVDEYAVTLRKTADSFDATERRDRRDAEDYSRMANAARFEADSVGRLAAQIRNLPSPPISSRAEDS